MRRVHHGEVNCGEDDIRDTLDIAGFKDLLTLQIMTAQRSETILKTRPGRIYFEQNRSKKDPCWASSVTLNEQISGLQRPPSKERRRARCGWNAGFVTVNSNVVRQLV